LPIFTFPDDASWNEAARAVEFGIEIGEYKGRVLVKRQVFQALLPDSPLPERCLEAYHLDRARFERAAEGKIERRQLTEDGNVELTLKDLRDTSS
jgi:hypothetical protein